MGICIFTAMLLAETALAIFCIAAKSYQVKTRSFLRIVVFFIFVLLTMVSVIQWSSRYYAIALVLLSFAVIGAIALIHRKKENRIYHSSYIILKAVGFSTLVFAATLPAIIFPQHNAIEPTGEYQVSTVTYSYTDTDRIESYSDTGEHRKLNVELWYPKNTDGSYPLIIFSHGGFGIKTSNISLYHELASHGYIVCSIDHTYQCLFTRDEKGHTTLIDPGYMKECSEEDAQSNRQQSFEYYQKWMKIRTDDINFVINFILSASEDHNADEVYQLVDKTKIGIMGHSLGGSAALGIGRMRKDVSAVIALESPFLSDIEGVENGEFVFCNEPYPLPVLNIYSDSSWSHLADWPQYAENDSLLSGMDSTAFNVHISGVSHLTLTDLALTSPLLTRIFNGQRSTTDTVYCLKTINKICLEFFDCYLKGQGVFTSGGTY